MRLMEKERFPIVGDKEMETICKGYVLANTEKILNGPSSVSNNGLFAEIGSVVRNAQKICSKLKILLS